MGDGWRIEPGAARGAITRAENEAQGFPDSESGLVGALSAAISALGGHGPATAARLSAVQTNPFEIDLRAAEQHVLGAIAATRQAIDAYVAGDEQMAATYENRIPQ